MINGELRQRIKNKLALHIADVMYLGGHNWIKTKGMYAAQCRNCEMKRIDHTAINGAKIAPSYSTAAITITSAHEPPCL